MKEVKKFRFIPILLAVILAVFLLLSSVTTIPAGHTGVVTTFGKVSGTVLGEGLHFKLPFITNVVKIDNRVLKTEVSSSSASKDLQTVNSTIALNYRIGRANSASIYQNIGTDFENVLINPAIQECVKSVTAQFTAEELITERQKVGDLMREALAEKIGPYGFDIEVFNITSFEFSEEFNAAIEAITEALKQNDKVQLVGFGAFEVKARAERIGRNPATGAEIKIAASKVPTFKAGKALKDIVG